jgi:RPA family protein
MNVVRKREVARRLFAFELNSSTHRIEQEGDKTPVYILTPTGIRCNRVFVVGVLLDKEEARPDSNFWRIRVRDPTGVFVCFVGRFQPDALEALLEIEPPEMVAIVGKVRIFKGETRKFVSLRPEQIAVVDSDVRNYWVYETAKRTLERIERMEKDKDDGDIALAWQIYNPNLDEYRDAVRQALLVVREEAKVFKAEEGEGEEMDIKTDEIEKLEEEFVFEEEEWDLSDILGE